MFNFCQLSIRDLYLAFAPVAAEEAPLPESFSSEASSAAEVPPFLPVPNPLQLRLHPQARLLHRRLRSPGIERKDKIEFSLSGKMNGIVWEFTFSGVERHCKAIKRRDGIPFCHITNIETKIYNGSG